MRLIPANWTRQLHYKLQLSISGFVMVYRREDAMIRNCYNQNILDVEEPKDPGAPCRGFL